ncbi:7 transmembrane receptor (rhodopsin family) domain-containing protein [Ditylenchus destructor]|nr:7 transmembrane receptor (rhodopsin family) domain-containing protein [Ditylenchus destructor]
MTGEILPSSSILESDFPRPFHLIQSSSDAILPTAADPSQQNVIPIVRYSLYHNKSHLSPMDVATTSSALVEGIGVMPSAEQQQPTDEFCSNSHIVSTSTIISFTETADSILFICTLLSSILQVYVMWLAIKHIRRKTSDKCLHVFLFSMTFADFILTALCYPVELAPRAGLIQKFPRYVSATMHMLCWIGLIVSSLSLVFLNLDKLFYFRFPLRYANFFTRARAIALVTASWVCSSLFVVFAWFTNSFHCVDEDCVTLAIFPNRLHIYVPFMIFVGVIPTVTSLIVAIYIMKIVAAHRKQMSQERYLLPPPDTNHKHNLSTNSANHNHGRSNSIFMSRMRTFYFIFMTTVFTAITLLPYRLAGLQRSLNPGGMRDCLTIMSFWVMMYMIYLHSIINPLLTVTVLPQYRMSFLNTIMCGRLKRAKKKEGALIDTVNRTASDL